MDKINKKLIIIKYWSNVLLIKNINKNFSIDCNNINNHWLIIDKIANPVIIISSWAIAFWSSLNTDLSYINNEIIKKRIYSALWNPYLSMNWNKYIPHKFVLQSLLTHRDLNSDISKEKILEIIHSIFNVDKQKYIIQLNDNDFITDEELVELRWWDFGDNDELTALLANLCSNIFDEVQVIVNTSSDWVLDENKEKIEIIKTDNFDDKYMEQITWWKKTSMWTWWMFNKLKVFNNLVKNTNNIIVNIINGKKPKDLLDLLNWKKVWTKILKN